MTSSAPAETSEARGEKASRTLRVLQVVALVLGVISLVVSSRLKLSGDLTDLFPKGPEAEALATFTRAFGGGDVGLVLVRGEDPTEVTLVAKDVSKRLEGKSTVSRVVAQIPDAKPVDPTLAWWLQGNYAPVISSPIMARPAWSCSSRRAACSIRTRPRGSCTRWRASSPR